MYYMSSPQYIYLGNFFVRGPDVPEKYLFAVFTSSNGLRLEINVNLQEHHDIHITYQECLIVV